MKKLFLLLPFVGIMATMFFVGCQKDITLPTTKPENGVAKVLQTPSKEDMNLKKNGDPSVTFEKLGANVKVENGILVFATTEDFTKTIKFLQNATSKEIDKWEMSLGGFQSVYRNYFNAKKELMETDNLALIKNKYQGKITFDNENNIQPIVKNGKTFGNIINEKAEYKVGKTLIAYYQDKVISIKDGERAKLEEAKVRLISDVKAGVSIHNLFVNAKNDNSPTVSLRSCSNGTNGCPTEIQQTVRSDNGIGNFRIRIHYNLVDNSAFLVNSSSGFWELHSNIFFDIDVDHERKRWYGWAGDRSGFTWGFGWGLSLLSQLGTRGACCGAGFGWSQGGWTWSTNEAFFNVDIPILTDIWSDDPNINDDLVETINNGFRLCLGRTGLVAHSFNTGVDHVDNEQFCWSDTSM